MHKIGFLFFWIREPVPRRAEWGSRGAGLVGSPWCHCVRPAWAWTYMGFQYFCVFRYY